MPRTSTYPKSIVCLESLWDDRVEKRPTVLALITMVQSLHHIRIAHLTCNTEPELAYNLKLLGRRRKQAILYLAFHGSTGSISLHDGTNVALEQLADHMGRRFAGWMVHFSSCSTLNVDAAELRAFCDATQVVMVSGYAKDVDWIEGVAMDILVFQALQNYVDMHACRKFLEKTYPDLIARTGFCAFL